MFTDETTSSLQLVVNEPDLIRTTIDTKTATVSLDDCLACSGCVTSAETVLIAQQSMSEVLLVLKEKKHTLCVLSIAPQARAALSVAYNIPSNIMHEKLNTYFKSLGFHLILDTSACTDLALVEAREEFKTRYKTQQVRKWKSPPLSLAISSTETFYPDNNGDSDPNPYTVLPMLTSACPGWVCYAEKSQSEALPHISTTKSPQQILGALVKRGIVASSYKVKAEDVYHVTLMPCYDKKLEASRKDFSWENEESLKLKEVDTVLTSRELVQYWTEENIDIVNLISTPLDENEMMFSNWSNDGKTLYSATTGEASVSGGYLEHIFRYSAKTLFNVDLGNDPLEYIMGRNNDIRHVELIVDGKVVLSFAQAYGFRNIQGVLNKLRRSKNRHDFVEIMACPGGCVNGGGQVPDQKTSDVIEALTHIQSPRDPVENRLVQSVYASLGNVTPGDKAVRELLHTRYHAVPKMERSNPMGIQW